MRSVGIPFQFPLSFLPATFLHGYEQSPEDVQLPGLVPQTPEQKIEALCMKLSFIAETWSGLTRTVKTQSECQRPVRLP